MAEVSVSIGNRPIGVVSPRLYGHFAEHLGRCCYGGLWVGQGHAGAAADATPDVDGFRADAVDALRELPVPLLRWPGGCYADHYHWRDGIGPQGTRRATLGMSCGLRVADDNALGTHEFLRLCELVGAEPYLAGNVGSGSVQELCDWVEYVNSNVDAALTRERAGNGRAAPWGVRLWGVGNESWDCGGRIDPETYGREFRRYATMMRHVDPGIELVAVGLEDEWPHGMAGDRDWNARVLETLGASVDLVGHLSIHRYWVHGGPETAFSEDDYYALLDEAAATSEVIDRTARTIAAYSTPGRIGIALDEWGVWHPEARDWGPRDPDGRRLPVTFEQAATLRDALAAAIGLEVFHRHCDVLSMANLAQVVNVLHAVLKTDGPACVRTPTYHALAMHRVHHGGTAYPVAAQGAFAAPSGSPALSGTATRRDGATALTLVNRHYRAPVVVRLPIGDARVTSATLLAADAPNATNTPAAPDRVAPRPLDVRRVPGGGSVELPAHSMATIEFRT